MAPRYHHGRRRQLDPGDLHSPMATGTIDINMDSGCRKAMYPDMALTAAQAQILHGPWRQHRPLGRVTTVVARSLNTNMAHVEAQTLGILRTFGNNRSHRHQHNHTATDKLRLDVTITPGGTRASHVRLFLACFASLDLPLSTKHEPSCLSQSPIPHQILTHCNGSKHWIGLCFSSQPRASNSGQVCECPSSTMS